MSAAGSQKPPMGKLMDHEASGCKGRHTARLQKTDIEIGRCGHDWEQREDRRTLEPGGRTAVREGQPEEEERLTRKELLEVAKHAEAYRPSL